MTESDGPNSPPTSLPDPVSPSPVSPCRRRSSPTKKKSYFDVIKKRMKNPHAKDRMIKTDALRGSLAKLVQRIAHNEEDPDCKEAQEALLGLKALRPAVMFILSADDYDCHYVIPLSEVPEELIQFLELFAEGTRDHLPIVVNRYDHSVADDAYRTFYALFEGTELDRETVEKWKAYNPPVNIVHVPDPLNDTGDLPYMMRFSVDDGYNEDTFPWHEYSFVRVPIRYSDTNMD